MKYPFVASAALVASTTIASAGGLDRSYQPIGLIFEEGNFAELSFGYVSPDLTGVDVLGNSISDVAGSFGVIGGGVKYQVNDELSVSLIFDQPYGSDVVYGGNPATTMLGGTFADAESFSLTALLKFQVSENVSVFIGPRYLRASGEIGLSGLAYGPVSGYRVVFDDAHGWGYLFGAAYEVPDIALRASLTYATAIDLDFPTAETFSGVSFGPSLDTRSMAPETLNFEFQTGVAKDTLLFGGIRWSHWSQFTLIPTQLGANLAQLDDAVTYTLGVGRRFTDKFSASAALSYESGGSDDLVSPLAPTNGFTALAIGARYQVTERVRITGGVRYTWVEDALPETGTPDVQRATFSDNSAWAALVKIGYSF